MERKIGDTFRFGGKTLQVKESEGISCDGCFFAEQCVPLRKEVAGECQFEFRTDMKEVIFVEITEEQPQELNLCEILKYCPEGEPLWSPMFGDVKLNDINHSMKLVNVILENGEIWNINADGTITFGDVTSQEIMLFPGKEQRDWTKVKYEKKLPKNWKEFCITHDIKTGEYFIGETGKIFNSNTGKRIPDIKKTLLPSEEAAEAHLALMQLHQLRDAWREGWVPDWKDDTQSKYVILKFKGEFEIKEFYAASRFLTFQDEKRADEFKDCFIDLIKQAGDLI